MTFAPWEHPALSVLGWTLLAFGTGVLLWLSMWIGFFTVFLAGVLLSLASHRRPAVEALAESEIWVAPSAEVSDILLAAQSLDPLRRQRAVRVAITLDELARASEPAVREAAREALGSLPEMVRALHFLAERVASGPLEEELAHLERHLRKLLFRAGVAVRELQTTGDRAGGEA